MRRSRLLGIATALVAVSVASVLAWDWTRASTAGEDSRSDRTVVLPADGDRAVEDPVSVGTPQARELIDTAGDFDVAAVVEEPAESSPPDESVDPEGYRRWWWNHRVDRLEKQFLEGQGVNRRIALQCLLDESVSALLDARGGGVQGTSDLPSQRELWKGNGKDGLQVASINGRTYRFYEFEFPEWFAWFEWHKAHPIPAHGGEVDDIPEAIQVQILALLARAKSE